MENTMEFEDGHVNYEAFGAVGDGVTDDLPAIYKAHEYANENDLPVRTKRDATYHLGRQALTVVITTDTDWNTSRFTIDDTDVEDHKASLFEVRSTLDPVELQIDKLTRDQRQLDARPEHDCFVLVENDNHRVYIRRGLNQNNGAPQHDCFILRKDGSIEADIDWEYDVVTRVEANPIPDATLYIRGGIFTTIANKADNTSGYDYWSRNIVISRSNTEIDGLTHYVAGETSVGCPYGGFVSARQVARIALRNCWATGHKIYQTIGSAGLPVSMGTYDYNANNVVGFTMIGCKMNHITDRTRWGVIGSNFCKDILLEDCTMSRMDTHMGVSGTYVIRRCNLGHMGLNAIGRGRLLLENSTLNGNTLVSFRRDYGSTWEGSVEIRNCKWIPACGEQTWPKMINVTNDGMHDFGYPCFMPEEVTIDGLRVEDTNVPDDYTGMHFFTDPEAGVEEELPADRPFPYAPCRSIKVRGLDTASGKKPSLSPSESWDPGSVTIEES
jgi:hypothetical protein